MRSGHVFLIRHGEKGGGTGLSPKGVARSHCIASLFVAQPGIDGLNASSSKSAHQSTTRKHRRIPVAALFSQNYRADGRRSRPYRTLLPLAKHLGLPVHHGCEREEARCLRDHIERETRKGRNVIVSWQHSALTDVARQLGVHGLTYPKQRYDVLFHLHNGKVRSITSEECTGLDEKFFHWRGHKGTRVNGKRLVPDDAWEDGFGGPDDQGRESDPVLLPP